MLQNVKDPKLLGIKLYPTRSNIIITKSGWKVTNYVGNDGNEYEKAERNGITRWFKV